MDIIPILFVLLPVVVGGFMVILLVSYAKRLSQKDSTTENYSALGMSMGMCLGVTLSSLLLNFFGALSITYGISFGALLGFIIGSFIKKK